MQGRAAHAHDHQQRRAGAAAFVVQLDLARPGMVGIGRSYTGGASGPPALAPPCAPSADPPRPSPASVRGSAAAEPSRRRALRAGARAARARTRASSRSATSLTSSHVAVGSATVCARVTVVQSSRRTLMPIVRPRRPFAARPGAQLLGHPRELPRASARGRAGRCRRCARATPRRPCARRRSRRRVRSARAGRAPRRGPARSARRARLLGRGATAASVSGRVRPGARRSWARCRARARRGEEAKRAHACFAGPSTTKPAGFSASEATFATSLFGPIPTEHVSCVAGLDLREQPSHRRARRGQALDVQVRLVEADDLDALDVRADEVHHLPGRLAVGREVGRQEHGSGHSRRAREAGIAEPTPKRAPRSWRS